MSNVWEKLIVALDITSESRLKEIIGSLSPKKVKFKVGLISYTRFGPKVIDWVKSTGADIFLDFKLYDIPNTMVETAKAFVDSGVWAFTVHAKAGKESLKTLKEELEKYSQAQNMRRPLIVGVTELTSKESPLEDVLKLAHEAKEAGIDGVVCSVWEAKKIKEELGIFTITPGIRKEKGGDDQKRVATVKDALEQEVSYFVVGRPIVKTDDPLAAAQSLLEKH